MIAASGSVLGIDVGFSRSRRTTCFCVLDWSETSASLAFICVRSDPDERRVALTRLVGSRPLSAIGVDGPLTRGLRLVPHYRAAEAMLSRGQFQKRGKPGQTSSPTGQSLHQHATALANLALAGFVVADSRHEDAIHERCVVEAFPNLFLAALVDETDLPTLARDASDRYWDLVVHRTNRLERLFERLLPGRRLLDDLASITDHEERAGVVCALTGLSAAAGDYVAVGDPEDGDIFLPPAELWGSDRTGAGQWFANVLTENTSEVRRSLGAHPNHRNSRIIGLKPSVV